MTTQAAPRTPSLAELLAIHAEAIRRSIHVSLPGRVEKYYADENRADIKPLLKDRVTTREGGELLEVLPVIPSVPIVFPRAGGFFITLPVAKGDLVELVFSDRSVDNFLSGRGTDTDPDDFRMHDLTDAFAILGGYPFGLGVTDSGTDNNLVLGKEGGAQIHVKPDQVSLYEENATAFVARADRSDTDDSAIKTNVDALRSAVSGWVPVPNDGGAALKTALAAWIGSSISLSGSAADKVKAT